MLAMVYLIAHVDRTNIGNARIEGLEKELQLTSMQWSFVLAIFFIPYVLLGKSRLCCFSSSVPQPPSDHETFRNPQQHGH